MLARAIVVVGTRSLQDAASDGSFPGDLVEQPARSLASLEILGQSVIERTITRLRGAGINAISIVSEAALPLSAGRRFIPNVLVKQAGKHLERVLLVRLGAYVEVDFADLLQSHHESGAVVTGVCDADGPLDIWALDATRGAPIGLMLDSPFDGGRPSTYLFRGYLNRLTDGHDLRRLAVDALSGRCAIRPQGREIKPGVWIDDGARVHRSVRIVAPAYIGRGARIHASALITRFSNVERCCVVDCGTAIENSSVLPYTHVGKGLDVAHAIIDGNRFVNLSRNVAFTIEDARIIRRTASGRGWFGLAGKPSQDVFPVTAGITLEPVASVATRQRPALGILSKGEV